MNKGMINSDNEQGNKATSQDGKTKSEHNSSAKYTPPVLGATVTMRKTHPCGSNLFTVVRTGADIKIRCNTCGRIIMMDLLAFSKAVKNWKI